MEFVVAISIACLIAVPYRKLKLKYMLMSQTTNVSGNEFYGSDEMIEAFNQQKQKKEKSEEQ